MKLDPVAKEVWCEALRSGEFKQGKKWLKRGSRYCCLGVAREIFPALSREGAHIEMLSARALDLLGLPFHAELHLINMNDDGKSFAEIADYIEQNL
jgi:hypothetical protein